MGNTYQAVVILLLYTHGRAGQYPYIRIHIYGIVYQCIHNTIRCMCIPCIRKVLTDRRGRYSLCMVYTIPTTQYTYVKHN